MLRHSFRTFRTLAATLPSSVSSNAAATRENNLKLIQELNEVEATAIAGGSEKAKKLHKSRDKFFSKFSVQLGCP